MTDELILSSAKLREKRNESTNEITEEQVAQYLKKNPEFFLNWENVLVDLKLPHHTGSAISLVERQVSILRDRNIDLRNRFAKLIEAATENDKLFSQTKRLELALMEAGSLVAIIQHLQHSLENDFNVDKAILLLFDSTTQDIDHRNPTNIARIVNSDDAHRELANILHGNQIICGPLSSSESEYVFGTNNGIDSAAVIPLHYKGGIGILAIGSNNKNNFDSNIDTLFIGHIGAVLSRLIRPYIVISPT